MEYKEWILKIKTKLMSLGYPVDYAEERANSLRGCYYDKNNHPQLSEAIFKLVTTGYTYLGNKYKINQFISEYKKTY